MTAYTLSPPPLQTLEFASPDTSLDDVYFDKSAGRFRWAKGGAGKTGTFVSREKSNQLMAASVQAAAKDLQALGDQLFDGDINLEQFQTEAARLTKRIAIQQTILGHGGIDRVTPEDWLRTGRRLKDLYYQGRDWLTGKPYGIAQIAQGLQQGNYSRAGLKNTLRMLGNAGRDFYWNGLLEQESKSGKIYGRRILGVTDNHCPECLYYASLGIQRVQDMVRPTQKCRCRTNCLCMIEPMTLEQAIAQGLPYGSMP